MNSTLRCAVASFLGLILSLPHPAAALRPTLEGPAESEVAAGLEENFYARMDRTAQAWFRAGWIRDAGVFIEPFVKARAAAQAQLARAPTTAGPIEAQANVPNKRPALSPIKKTDPADQARRASALWTSRLKALDFFARAALAIAQGHRTWQELEPGDPRRGVRHFTDTLTDDPSGETIPFAIRVRTDPRKPLLTIIFYRKTDIATAPLRAIGHFRIGADGDNSAAKPVLHLDIQDDNFTPSWFRHENLVWAWSGSGQTTEILIAFAQFLQELLRLHAPREGDTSAPAAGLEEAIGAVARLREGPAAVSGSVGSEALVFTDPETFDLAVLAVRWGWIVAVPDDGPEAAGLEALLSALPEPKGPCAVGILASSRFLEGYPRQILVDSRPKGFRILDLRWDDLPPPVAAALESVLAFLDRAVSA